MAKRDSLMYVHGTRLTSLTPLTQDLSFLQEYVIFHFQFPIDPPPPKYLQRISIKKEMSWTSAKKKG